MRPLRRVLHGFWLTLSSRSSAGVLSLIWGLILAVLRQLPGRALAPVRWLTIAYIDVFRGIPLLLSCCLADLGQPVRVTGPDPGVIGIPTWFGEPAPFWYGVIALTITYGAYMAEVYRAGIEAVPERADGGRALARHEPRPGDALRDRPAGGPQGDPAAAQRLHRADEGHLAGQRDRAPRSSRPAATSSRRPSTARR